MTDATADERLLREGLTTIADAVDAHAYDAEPAGDIPLPAGAPRRPSPVRRRWMVLGAAAAVAVAGAVGISSLRDSESPRAEGPGGSTTEEQSEAEWVACAEVIVDGTVTSVAETEGPGPGRVDLVIDVTEWVKPRTGPDIVEIVVRDPRSLGEDPIAADGHYLFVVPTNTKLPPAVISEKFIDDYRKIIEAAQAEAANTECPEYWRNTDGGS